MYGASPVRSSCNLGESFLINSTPSPTCRSQQLFVATNDLCEGYQALHGYRLEGLGEHLKDAFARN